MRLNLERCLTLQIFKADTNTLSRTVTLWGLQNIDTDIHGLTHKGQENATPPHLPRSSFSALAGDCCKVTSGATPDGMHQRLLSCPPTCNPSPPPSPCVATRLPVGSECLVDCLACHPSLLLNRAGRLTSPSTSTSASSFLFFFFYSPPHFSLLTLL